MSVWMDAGNIALLCLQGYTTCFFFYHILETKRLFKRIFPLACLVMTVSILILYTDYWNIPFRNFIFFSSTILICKVLYQASWKSICFMFTLQFAAAGVCDLLLLFIMQKFFHAYIGFPDGKELLIANSIGDVIYFIEAYVLLLIWKKRKNLFLPQSIYATILFPVSQFFLTAVVIYYVNYRFTYGQYHMGAVFCTIAGSALCIFADIILFQVIMDNSKKERLAAQIEMMNEQARREFAYYSSINEKIQEIRKIRHDFNNQLQTAYGAIAGDRADGQEQAAQLLSQLEKQIQEQEPVYYCPNLIVNVILEEKARMAGEQQIAMDISVELPEQIAIEKSDLCSIFSRLLDHAVYEAGLTDKSRPVTVRARIQSGFCMIRVTNPFSDSPDHARNQEKDSVYGYGLRILHDIAGKYHGEFRGSDEDGIFTADLTLKL